MIHLNANGYIHDVALVLEDAFGEHNDRANERGVVVSGKGELDVGSLRLGLESCAHSRLDLSVCLLQREQQVMNLSIYLFFRFNSSYRVSTYWNSCWLMGVVGRVRVTGDATACCTAAATASTATQTAREHRHGSRGGR